MSQISSINFKKSIAINTAHNDRTLAPSYLISDRGVECNRTDEQARELKNQIIIEAKETYTNRTGQRFQAKTYEWSAVCNIKPDTTMQDLDRLADYIGDKYGFQCYQIAIHRDEGHIDENGKEQINHHAHLEFITLDKHTGINRQRELTPQKLRELQSEVSQILEMQRGEDKRKSGRQRTEPRQYAKQKEAEKQAVARTKKQTKEQLEAEILTLKERNALLEQARKDSKGKGLLKSFFNGLSSIKKSDTHYTQAELLAEIERLKEQHKKQDQEIAELKQECQTLIDENSKHALYSSRLEQRNEQLSQELKQKDEIIKAQNVQISELKAENTELKSFIKRAFNYIRKNSRDIFDFVKIIFSNAFTEPLLNELEKDKEFIDQDKKTQQRANLTPLQPDNNQEQKQEHSEQEQQQNDKAKPQERSFKPKIHRR